MFFNSLSFLAFFAGVLVVHHLPLPWGIRKWNLVVASYIFYGAWKWPFAGLLLLSTAVDWLVARRMDRAASDRTRRAWLLLSLVGNLGLLAFFKYGAFLQENLVIIVNALGVAWHPTRPEITLPPGISFYTFQTLSYTIDVFRRRLRASASLIDFACFVAFFPQLVAGPIVRAADFLPQLTSPRRANARQFSWGLTLMAVGLFQKVVVADGLLAPVVDDVFSSTGKAGFIAAWAGAFAFGSQIFCDFAGYSSVAIGAALCLGFWLPDNFRGPYGAIGFSDFWHRWHVSLSTWLRDYLYIPLGGNRKGPGRTIINLMATMLLGGLWHGASWTFVVWGGLHGLFLVAERIWTEHGGGIDKLRTIPDRLTGLIVTFLLVSMTWVFFRAHTFSEATQLLVAMGGFRRNGYSLDRTYLVSAFGVTAYLVIMHRITRDASLEGIANRRPWWVRGVVTGLLLAAICLMSSGIDRAFIYFQF